MYDDKILKDINRLRFEDIIWIIFALISLLNVLGDEEEILYLEYEDETEKSKAKNIFLITIIITIFIYLYFITRNYFAYTNCKEEEKSLYFIKFLGSTLLISGALCLLYFQIHEDDFTGSPAI